MDLTKRQLQEFNKTFLKNELNEIIPQIRSVLGVASAERIFPFYVQWSKETSKGDLKTLRNLLNQLWDHILEGKNLNEPEIKELYKKALETDHFLPRSDDSYSGVNQTYAEEVVSSVFYSALGVLGDLDMLVTAVEQESELLDSYIAEKYGIPFEEPDEAKYEERLKLMKDGLSKQVEDLNDLKEMKNISSDELLKIKKRASETKMKL